MTELTRRRVLGVIGGLLVAPAIVRAASLMPVRGLSGPWLGIDFATGEDATAIAIGSHNSLLAINLITREAVRLWKNSNVFLLDLDENYAKAFGKSQIKI